MDFVYPSVYVCVCEYVGVCARERGNNGLTKMFDRFVQEIAKEGARKQWPPRPSTVVVHFRGTIRE